MTRRLAALVAAWGIVLTGFAILGPAVPRVLGHSQLVTSIPAAGDVTPTSPAELRLVFSEPIDPAQTKLDLIGPTGAVVAPNLGAPDATDRYMLIAAIPHLADGIYAVDWRAVSATDGHTTSGLYTFGVASASPPPQPASAGPGSIDLGHGPGLVLLETESRVVGDLGFLLAAGLPVIAWLVLRDPRSAGAARTVALALAAGAVGASGQLVVGAALPGVDIAAYVAGNRVGLLAVIRIGIGLAGTIVVWRLATVRPAVALAVGWSAAALGLLLIAAGGHAAASPSPAPLAAIVVHLVAVAVWLSGVLGLAWIAVRGGPLRRRLGELVPRFSALALVAVGLIAVTGIYSDWIQTGSLVSLGTPYGVALAVKIDLAIAAFALGGLSFLSTERGPGSPFRLRILLESGFAIAALVATGVLATGAPPAAGQPVAIAEAPSSAVSSGPAPVLELAPGRPGPTRFIVVTSTDPNHTVADLSLRRLDAPGESDIPLRQLDADPNRYVAAGGLLPARSRWEATVVLTDHDDRELARARYAFALDDKGISEGRATPPIDPALVLAAVLLVATLVGVSFTVGGGRLPRSDPATSRVAVLSGAVVGSALGLVLALAGAHR